MEEWTRDEIFLNDPSIQQVEPPAKEWSVWMTRYNASTVITRLIWVDSIVENFWEYHLVATAIKHEAEIQRINPETGLETNSNPVKDSVLFSGSITIINAENDIPWTEMIGKIWTAKNNSPEIRKSNSLRELILGYDSEVYRSRIEAILQWYKSQKIGRKEEEKRRENESYIAGRASTGRGPWGNY